MYAVVLTRGLYCSLAVCVLFVHGMFILWVIFGALLARSRPILKGLHIASLAWGIFTEVLPWPCPLTLLENRLEGRAGIEPYEGGFLLQYLDKLIYPDISATALITCGRLRLCAQPWVLCSANVDRQAAMAPEGSARTETRRTCGATKK